MLTFASVSSSTLIAVIFVSAISFSCCQEDQQQYGRLVLAILHFRHGARAPERQCPGDLAFNVNEDFPEGLGQLTQRGEDESFELGTLLRKRYDGFLPEVYHADDVYVRSASTDRNLVTSYLVMDGLFPPLNRTSGKKVFWQSVPVQTAPVDCELLLQDDPACPANSAEFKLIQKTDEYRCLERKSQPIAKYVKEMTGSSNLIDLTDCFIAESYQGLSLPNWTKEVFPEPITTYTSLHHFFLFAGTRRIQRLFDGLFFQEVRSILKRKIMGTLSPDRKLFAYSSHDTNIYSLLTVLGFNDAVLPEFSSCLFFELWNATEPSNQYLVTVSYRNGTSDPRPLKLPGCASIACTWQEFSAVIQRALPFSKKECFDKSVYSQSHLVLNQPTSVPDYWKECFNNTET